MVGQFQKNVLIVSAVVFLIVMIVIGVIMKKSLLDGKYPPEVGMCPDYFDAENMEGTKVRCINRNPRMIGKKGAKEGDEAPTEKIFDTKRLKTDLGKVEACKWAKNYGFTWDGYTNMNYC